MDAFYNNTNEGRSVLAPRSKNTASSRTCDVSVPSRRRMIPGRIPCIMVTEDSYYKAMVWQQTRYVVVLRSSRRRAVARAVPEYRYEYK
jgi:hypothetical protein